MNRRQRRESAASIVTDRNRGEVRLVDVPDPYNPGKIEQVRKNVRVHPLDLLLARKRIDDAQKTAGDRFLQLYEAAEIGVARAIDYTRQKVDVSFTYPGLDPAAMEAVRALADIHIRLGGRSFALLRRLIGERMSVYQVAGLIDGEACGLGMMAPSRATVAYTYRAVAFALDDLVRYFGVAVGSHRSRIRAERAVEPQHVD